MSKPFIELITSESGDWEVLRVDMGEGFHAEGHSISNYDWIELLDVLGYKVEEIEVSDEEMEEGGF